EETTLRAQPERARLPTLCALSTSATSFCGRCAHHAEFLAPNGGRHSAEGPLLAHYLRSLRRSDLVRLQDDFCRDSDADNMRAPTAPRALIPSHVPRIAAGCP